MTPLSVSGLNGKRKKKTKDAHAKRPEYPLIFYLSFLTLFFSCSLKRRSRVSFSPTAQGRRAREARRGHWRDARRRPPGGHKGRWRYTAPAEELDGDSSRHCCLLSRRWRPQRRTDEQTDGDVRRGPFTAGRSSFKSAAS